MKLSALPTGRLILARSRVMGLAGAPAGSVVRCCCTAVWVSFLGLGCGGIASEQREATPSLAAIDDAELAQDGEGADGSQGGESETGQVADAGLTPAAGGAAAMGTVKGTAATGTGGAVKGTTATGTGTGTGTAGTAGRGGTVKGTPAAGPVKTAPVVVNAVLPELPSADADGGIDLGLRVDDLTLLVIFDRSGSMSAPWDARSRWQVASDVLMHEAVGPVRDSITVGALLFPQAAECTVEELGHELQFDFTLGDAFIEKWERNAAMNQPGGGTPLSAAFEAADRAIVAAGAAGRLEERFRVIVLTDGEPTCDSNAEALTALPRSNCRRPNSLTRKFGPLSTDKL